MKLRNIITSVFACVLMAVGCQQPQEFDVLKGLTVSESVVALPQDGGAVKVTVSSDAPWEVTASSRWITVSPMSGNAGETEVSFSVLKTKKERSGEVTITSGENEQHLEFIQAYVAEGQGGPREFVKVDKVQGNKLYLIVFQKDGKPHAMKSLSAGGVSGGYNYGYGELQELTSEISADGNKITLNHQDWSYLVRTSGDGFTMQHLGNKVYLGNNAGYSSISHGDENVPGSVWKFEFLADGTVKVKNGSMWMHYSSKYGNIELTASEPAGDIPVLYEDTQDPDLPEMTWSPVSVSDVTATAASFAASFAYNGIEPLDGAGFIVKTEDANVTDKAKKEFKIKVELGADGKFSANTENLVAGVKYTVTAYLEYEGLTSKSEPVEFTTKATEAKTIKVAEFVKILKGMDLTGNVSLSAVPVDYVEGIVTAVNGDGQNLYKGLTLEDGTGEPNSGVFFYASKYNNAFAAGTKVKLALADAVATSYNGLIQITDGELTEVSKDNEYTLAKFSADTIDFADYVGMYVTVVDAKCAAEVGTVWNDGTSSNASVDFTSKDGKVEFAAKTYKTSPWAKNIVGVKSTGNISGVVQVNKEDYSILPIKAADVAAFANTDPEITAVSETALSWQGFDVAAVTVEVTGERLKGLSAGVDNDHWTVSVNGNKVTATPNEANITENSITGVLTINAVGGNSATVKLTHVNLPMGTGTGTEADPYDAIKAWRLANALGNSGETVADVYIQGTVSKINELSTSYGNATYYITDDKGTVDFYVYRGKNVGNTNFASASELKVGDKVLLFGSLSNYKGTSPQLATGNYIVKFFESTEDEEEGDSKVDVLTFASTGLEGATTQGYQDWTYTAESGVVYAGQSNGGYADVAYIQISSSNNNSGIVSTTTAGKVAKVTVTWNAKTTSGRTLQVYGNSSAYAVPADLYDTAKQGNKLGELVYNGTDTVTELTVTGNTTYIGMRSASGAMYIDKIEITWAE